MTTEQPMLKTPAASRCLAALALACIMLAAACESTPRSVTPRSLSSPYSTVEGEFLWAVAPLRNESGTSAVDHHAVSDALVNQIHQVHGISVIPLNRSIGAMRALDMPAVGSAGEAARLARELGADAIVVGTITSWDPYDPPKLGLSLALFVVRDDLMLPAGSYSVDPRALQVAPTDYTLPTRSSSISPLSTASAHMDASNHEVLDAVRAYAEGRVDHTDPMGWRRYVASMTLFTEFVCHRLTERLLDQERIRLARALAEAE